MKHLVTYAISLVLLLCALPAQGQIPRIISFQGVLSDAGGQAVDDGTYDITLSLYGDRTSGTALWTETQSVEVQDGVFGTLIGGTVPLTLDFDIPYFLGIAVDGDPELQPRTRLAAAPYALHASTADQARSAETASGLDPNATGVVTALNNLDGDIELVGAGGTTVTQSGGTITVTSSGGGAGILSIQNDDGTISVLNPTGPATTLGLHDAAITEQKLADLAVTTDKLGNHAVTDAKLADNAVTTGIIAPGAVMMTHISSVGASAGQVLSFDGSDVGWSTPATGGVTGSGGAGELALWTGATDLAGDATLVYDGDRLGVGTGSPAATLHVSGNDGVMVQGVRDMGAVMNPGVGTRMHWYSRKSAFRAGHVNGDEWNDANVGRYSVAMGFETIASDVGAVAMGSGTTASALAAFAFGGNTTASARHAMAFGIGTTASEQSATAMGSNTTASGKASTATGYRARTIGDYAFACGSETLAEGVAAFATGYDTHAAGHNSVAMGHGSIASGNSSLAIGMNTVTVNDYSIAAGNNAAARGPASAAFGLESVADAQAATAIGTKTVASGNSATAIGYETEARGPNSVAMGSGSIAVGNSSLAAGFKTSAGGHYSMAIGYETTASGDYSTALGTYARTTGNTGAFVIGDNSTTNLVSASTDNQMTMRFEGGYRFYTSADLSTGAFIAPGGSGWSSPSDRNKKENFSEIDGEKLLDQIRGLPVTEWNYIGTDPSVRYIGPMAQDFWQAFHLAGTDSLSINSIAIDGVNLAAIKALERRTRELRDALSRIVDLEARITALETRIDAQNATTDANSRFTELEARIDELARQ